MNPETCKTSTLLLFCLLAVLALPLTVLFAVVSSLGGDRVLLQVLRGKISL